MRRKLLFVMATLGLATSLAVMAFAAGKAGQARVAAGEPDMSSPNWKQLSDDVGVMIRDDEALGLRGRLYVRVDGAWLPVATDGPGDTVGAIPIRK